MTDHNRHNYSKLADLIRDLKPHDHLCLIYESREEWLETVVPFILSGLERGEKCLYVVDANTAQEIKTIFEETGSDVDEYERKGQFSVIHERDSYTREGYFDPDLMIALLISETEKALQEGYSALRVTGEMSWALRGYGGAEKVLEYESKLNQDLFPIYPCVSICQYDRWKFDPETIKGVVLTHPLLIRGGQIYRNFYYIEPEEYLNHKRGEREVQHWLNNLERERKTQESLRESEEKHRRLFETMAQGVIYQAADGAIISANPAAERILGLSFEQMQGKTSMDPRWQMIEEGGTHVPGTDHPAMIALRTGKKVGPVTRGVFHPDDNAHIWLNIMAIPLFQPGETEPFQAYATFDDITERKHAERDMQNLVENAPDMIVRFNTDLEHIYCNKAVEDYWGVPAESFLGKTTADLVRDIGEQNDGTLITMNDTLQQCLETRKEQRVELRYRLHGEEKYFSTRVVPEFNNAGHIESLLAVTRDTTARKQAEEALEYRLQFEKLVSEISSRFINLPSEEIDEGISYALKLTGEFYNVDRSYVFQFSTDRQTMSNTHEWCNHNVEPQLTNLQNLSVYIFPWLMEKLEQFETVDVGNVADLPPEATVEKNILQAQSIQSVLVAPLVWGNELHGFMGFGSVTEEKTWTSEELSMLKVVAEITSNSLIRNLLEKALHYERSQILSIFDSINEVIYVSDPQTYEILYVNQHMKRLFSKDLVGGICYRELQNKEAPCEFCNNRIIMQNKGEPYQWEYHNPQINRDLLITDKIITWPDGRDVRFELAIDITGRKKAEKSLREREEELRKIYQNAPIVLILLDENRNIRQINDYATFITNKSLKDLIGLRIGKALGCIHADDAQETQGLGSHCERCQLRIIINDTFIHGKSYQQVEVELPLLVEGKKEKLFVLASTTKLNFYDQPLVLVSLQDVSELKITEQQLKSSYSKMEALSKRILRSQEEDRSRLARELHDEVGQALTAVKLDLQMLDDELSRQGYTYQKKLSQSVDLVDATLERVRRQSGSLRPPALDDMGLIAAVQSMAKGFGNRTKINASVKAEGFTERLSRELETALFRCVQEALTNIARHARAQRVTVDLKQDQQEVSVVIKDDGIGFRPEEVKASMDHIGLIGMKERVGLLQGKIVIDSHPGGGTAIYIAIPMKKRGVTCTNEGNPRR